MGGFSLHPSPQPEVNHVPLEGPMLEAPGRSLIGLSGVLTVGSSRCLHSHAEALRVRGWGHRKASTGVQSWELLAGLTDGEERMGQPVLEEGQGSRPGLPDAPPFFPLGEMCKLHQEIPLHSGLPAAGETGLSIALSLRCLPSLLPRCPIPSPSSPTLFGPGLQAQGTGWLTSP